MVCWNACQQLVGISSPSFSMMSELGTRPGTLMVDQKTVTLAGMVIAGRSKEQERRKCRIAQPAQSISRNGRCGGAVRVASMCRFTPASHTRNQTRADRFGVSVMNKQLTKPLLPTLPRSLSVCDRMNERKEGMVPSRLCYHF